jgi:hypothetical protein
MTQGTPRKCTKPTYIKKPPKARCKYEVRSDVRETRIVNWRQVAQDGGEQLEGGKGA